MARIEVRGACPHDCPDTCAWIADVDDGVVTAIHGDPEHPVTAGHLCVKVQKYEERTYHPDRLLSPLIRTGEKGSDSFREATWDEALVRVRDGLVDAVERGSGTSVLPWNYMGTQGVLQGGPAMDARFCNALGAASLEGTICFAAGATAWGLTYPGWQGADIEDAVHARTVVAWGANMFSTHLHLWKFFLDARKRGATIVCVDPVHTKTARAADIHLQLRPGSDAALALGAMHVLFAEGLADESFLAERARGVDELRARAGEWPLSRAAAATGLSEEQIAAFARLIASGPMFLKIGPGAQRHADAGQGVRAALMLPAVTGAWRHPGGGALVHSAGTFQRPHAEMARPELRGDRPNRQVNMVLLGRALEGELDGEPPLTGLITYNANPMVVAPDTTAVRKGLAREDLFTVSIEQFATDTTRYADVVLPATTQLEHLDVLWSWGHRYLTLNRPAIAPRGQSRPNTEIFRMMAGVMAEADERFSHKSFAEDDEELLATYLAAYPLEVADGVRERGWAKVVVSDRPDVKVDLLSERAGALGLDSVPDGRDPEPDDGRFTVVTPKSHHFLNSTFVNHARLHRMAGAPVVRMATADAGRMGVTDGARVLLRSDSGEIEVAAEVADDVLLGSLELLSNWWGGDFAGGAGVNVLTSQQVADLGGAPVFTPRVELSLVRV